MLHSSLTCFQAFHARRGAPRSVRTMPSVAALPDARLDMLTA